MSHPGIMQMSPLAFFGNLQLHGGSTSDGLYLPPPAASGASQFAMPLTRSPQIGLSPATPLMYPIIPQGGGNFTKSPGMYHAAFGLPPTAAQAPAPFILEEGYHSSSRKDNDTDLQTLSEILESEKNAFEKPDTTNHGTSDESNASERKQMRRDVQKYADRSPAASVASGHVADIEGSAYCAFYMSHVDIIF